MIQISSIYSPFDNYIPQRVQRVWSIGVLIIVALLLLNSCDGDTKKNDLSNNLPRTNHSVVWKDGKVFVIGGVRDNDSLDDVLESSDGINWSTATKSAPFGRRSYLGAVVFNEQIIIVGGFRLGAPGNVLADVWRSADGRDWQLVSDQVNWEAREHHGLVVFRDHIYLFGGLTYKDPDPNSRYRAFSDVWRSRDGKDWQLVTDKAPWGTRRGFGFAVYQDRIWLVGGLDSYDKLHNDVWSSVDGETWIQHTKAASWAARSGVSTIAFNGKLWLFGGWCGYGCDQASDIWSSSDGENWQQLSPHGAFGRRAGFRPIQIDGGKRLMIVGGTGPGGLKNYGLGNYVFVSANGKDWKQVSSELAK